MKHNIIALLGSNPETVFVGIKEFPTEKVFLLDTGKHSEGAEELKKDLQKFRIPYQLVEVKGEPLEGMFRAFAQIKAAVGDEALVNISSGDSMSTCAALSASFVNGLKAFQVVGDKVQMLPVLKFSYYRILPEKKLGILKFLRAQPDCCLSLEELSERTKMSLALCSYHINGNSKVEGMVSLGLVEIHEGARGRTQVVLTELGKLIADGQLENPPEAKLEARV